MDAGSGSLSCQRTGQLSTQQNIYTAVPLGRTNTIGDETVQSGGSGSIRVTGNDCYSCWYFVRVTVTTPSQAKYRLSVTHTSAAGADLTDIGTNIPTKQFELPRGRYAKGRFMLDSPDNFIFLANTAGEVEVYVGLDADRVSAREGTYLWSTVSRAGIAQLAISTSDRNFHMGTWYYFYVYAREESLLHLEVK